MLGSGKYEEPRVTCMRIQKHIRVSFFVAGRLHAT